MSRYDEDTLVQQTTAEYLESQLGWTSVYAFNTETFGPDSLLGRTSDRDVVLTRSLRSKLKELNPDLPDAAYDDAVRQVTTTVTAQSLIATNREKYTQVRDGVTATFRNDKGEVVKQRLTLIDFDNPQVSVGWQAGSLPHFISHDAVTLGAADAVGGVQTGQNEFHA